MNEKNEKRVWNIEVGKIPKGEAEKYIKSLIEKYKKKNSYDLSTGKVDSTQNSQELSEDVTFWTDKEKFL